MAGFVILISGRVYQMGCESLQGYGMKEHRGTETDEERRVIHGTESFI